MTQKLIYDLFVFGKPKAQPRSRKGKYGNFYNPSSADVWKETIQAKFLSKRKDKIRGPVAIVAYFYFYALREKHKESPHTVKPDIDNLVKSVLDALKGIGVYDDDCQVYSKYAVKFWTNIKANEGMNIWVSEITE